MIGLNDSQEFKKIRGQMDTAEIKDPKNRENYLLRLLVDTKAELKAELKAAEEKATEAEKDRVNCKKLDR